MAKLLNRRSRFPGCRFRVGSVRDWGGAPVFYWGFVHKIMSLNCQDILVILKLEIWLMILHEETQ